MHRFLYFWENYQLLIGYTENTNKMVEAILPKVPLYSKGDMIFDKEDLELIVVHKF